jgi:uncharacterized membrane protein
VTDDELMGPVSYVIAQFPGSKMTGEGFPILVDLVDRGLIRILDLVFVTKAEDGTTAVLELSDLDRDGHLEVDLAVFDGVSSGLIGDSDIAEASKAIEPGSSAGVLLFENRWAAPFVQALRGGGAEVVAAGYITQEDLVAALDVAEA